MNKIFIVLLFILLGSSLIVINNIKGNTKNSFIVEYQNNKNLSLPNLTGGEAIAPNVFRLYNANGIIIDYELISGVFTIDGTKTSNFSYILTDLILQWEYTLSYHYVSGSMGGTLYIGNTPGWNLNIYNYGALEGYKTYKTITRLTTQNFRLYFDFFNANSFNQYKFKLQLEKGSRATSYIVPKLIPIYKDNLTHDEKQQIGMGAFEGIPQIIRTINNILKPVTDFVNGILSIFS